MTPNHCLIVAILLALTAAPAAAVDGNGDLSPETAVLQQARAAIEAGAFPAAIATLEGIIAEGPVNADALNLLGYANRKAGDLVAAEAWYDAALRAAPDHLGALEYQGELFIMTDRTDLAQANLARLASLCGACPEHADLAEALGAP